jgi:hypothetical protein
LVVDFLAGTLDLSLVPFGPPSLVKWPIEAPICGRKYWQKSDAYVGGEDIDIWIVERLLRRHHPQTKSNRLTINYHRSKIPFILIEAKKRWFNDNYHVLLFSLNQKKESLRILEYRTVVRTVAGSF